MFAVGIGNSVMTPSGVIRPIACSVSVNQRLPSGPAVMLAAGCWPWGSELGDHDAGRGDAADLVGADRTR